MINPKAADFAPSIDIAAAVNDEKVLANCLLRSPDVVTGATTSASFPSKNAIAGFPGGQAEYLRVPFADVGPIKVPDGLTDDQVLFLSDIFPTGWMAAENADIKPGHTVLVFGCGPVGQFAIRSAFMMGAERVIAIDEVEERLAMAEAGGAETIDFSAVKGELQDEILALTGGRGPDSVIEAVGLESHGSGSLIEKTQEAVAGKMERAYAFNQAIVACRPGGTISLPGVFVGGVPVMMGAFVGKGLTLKTGQTHVQRYLEPLLQLIVAGKIDPSFLVTHTAPLKEGPDLYKTFRDKKDGCIKVVMKPHG